MVKRVNPAGLDILVVNFFFFLDFLSYDFHLSFDNFGF